MNHAHCPATRPSGVGLHGPSGTACHVSIALLGTVGSAHRIARPRAPNFTVIIPMMLALAARFTWIGRRMFRKGRQPSRSRVRQIDLSGKWNDTDSRQVSEEMIADCLNQSSG